MTKGIGVVALALGSAAWFGGIAWADAGTSGRVAVSGPPAAWARAATAIEVVAPAAGARTVGVDAEGLAARALAEVDALARKPRVDSVRRAFARALQRGWRYTGSARHVAVQVPRPPRGLGDGNGNASREPGRSSLLPGTHAVRPAALLDSYADGRAEVTVWGWDDGDPATVEGTVFLYAHDTGEEFYFDVQHFAASDTDGWVTWGVLIDYRGGWAYHDDDPGRTRWGSRVGVEFGGEVGAVPAALQLGGPNASISAYSRQRCLRDCLDRKMNNVFNATRTGALSSFIACTRSPATRVGLVVYASCVGGGTLGGFAIALTNEFVFTTSCGEAC